MLKYTKIKLLSMTLCMVLAVVMLAGCQAKSNSYFDEVKKMVDDQSKVVETSAEVKLSGKYAKKIPDEYKENGVATIGYKLTTQHDDAGNLAIGLGAKFTGEKDYNDVVKVIAYDKVLYIDGSGILTFLEKYDPEAAVNAKTALALTGLTGAAKFDMAQIAEACNVKWEEDTQKENLDSIKKFELEIIKMLEENFGDLSTKEGKDFALKIDGTTVDKELDAFIASASKNTETFINQIKSIVEVFVGKEQTDKIFTPSNKTITDLEKEAEKAENDKNQAIQNLKDINFNFTSIANAEDHRIEFKSENIGKGEDLFSFNVMIKGSVETPDFEQQIPKAAIDMTPAITSIINLGKNNNNK